MDLGLTTEALCLCREAGPGSNALEEVTSRLFHWLAALGMVSPASWIILK